MQFITASESDCLTVCELQLHIFRWNLNEIRISGQFRYNRVTGNQFIIDIHNLTVNECDMKDIPSFRVNGEYAHIRVCENLLNAHPIIHCNTIRIVMYEIW